MEQKGNSQKASRWLVILALGLILGLLAGYIGVRQQAPVYQATAKILVLRTPKSSTNDPVYLNSLLPIQSYMELLKTKSVLADASAKSAESIKTDNIAVTQGTDGQTINVAVESGKKEQAAQMANALAQALIDQTNADQADRFSMYEKALNDQIAAADKQVGDLQDTIQKTNQGVVKEQLAQVREQITQLGGEIAVLEKDIAAYPPLLTSAQRVTRAEKESQLEQKKSLFRIYQEIETNLTYTGKPAQSGATRDANLDSLQQSLNYYQQLELSLMNEMQGLQLARTQYVPVLKIIDPAVAPVSPVRPQPMFYMVLAGAAGFLLALGWLMLASFFQPASKPVKVEAAV